MIHQIITCYFLRWVNIYLIYHFNHHHSHHRRRYGDDDDDDDA